MTKKILQLVVVLLIAAQGVIGQTVQVVSLSNASPGDVLVQVDMDGFTDVSAITLYMEYDSDLLNFTGITNTTLTGTWIANYNSAIDKLIITYTAAQGYSNNPTGKLFDIQFFNKGGFSSDITFDEDNCEIVEFLTPIATTYTDGTLTQGASVGNVSMSTYTGAAQGSSLTIPVTFQGTGFGSVDGITLKVSYDETSLFYTGLANNTLTGVVASASGGVITLNWSSATAQNFMSSTNVFDFQFTYNGVGSTVLYFIPGCEISSSTTPLATSYVNGLVTPYDDGYTFTLGTVGATTDSSAVNVPVVASGFTGPTDVGAITLNIAYHDSLNYTGYSAVQGSGWVMSGNSNNVLSFTMSVLGGFDLEDGDLLTLNFMYDYDGGGVADISFNPGCEVLAASAMELVPMIYVNGSVTSLSLTFTVEDSGGTPITDAVITLDGTTYSAGQYVFTGLANGTYAYSVAKTGYAPTSGSVVFSGSSLTETVVLYGFTVTFDVEDSDNVDITDAIVTFDGTTNAAGDYVFTDVIDGTYGYSVSRTGYETTTGNAVVNGADLTETVILPSVYTVTFTVVDGVSTPITDAVITFDGTTYAAGTYVFSDLVNDTYAYSVSKIGYTTATGSVIVSGSNVTEPVVLNAVFTVDGQLTYMGDVARPIGTSGSSTTTVYLKNVSNNVIAYTSSTDASGNYTFSNVLTGNYYLDASTNIDATNSYDVTDAYIIYYNGGVLTGLEALAADVNMVGGVDVTDAYLVYYSWLGGNIKVGAWTSPDWIFNNETVNITTSNAIKDFSGICSGDANGTFVPIP